MPSRVLREGILTSDRVDQLDAGAEVFYRRLMSVVDDYGRFDARPIMLRVACFPLRVDRVREADISRWIAICEKAGLIALYAVNGRAFLEMQDFRQAVRAKQSKYPPPPNAQHVRSTCTADATQTKTSVPEGEVEGGVGIGDEDGGELGRAGTGGRLREPGDEHRQLARDLGLDCNAEFTRYRDYLTANGKRHRNEAAGFRNWLRKGAEFKPKGGRHDAIQAVNAEIWKGAKDGNDRDITAESERLA